MEFKQPFKPGRGEERRCVYVRRRELGVVGKVACEEVRGWATLIVIAVAIHDGVKEAFHEREEWRKDCQRGVVGMVLELLARWCDGLKGGPCYERDMALVTVLSGEKFPL